MLDTATVVQQLDLVITVYTAVAHLASSLRGKPSKQDPARQVACHPVDCPPARVQEADPVVLVCHIGCSGFNGTAVHLSEQCCLGGFK